MDIKEIRELIQAVCESGIAELELERVLDSRGVELTTRDQFAVLVEVWILSKVLGTAPTLVPTEQPTLGPTQMCWTNGEAYSFAQSTQQPPLDGMDRLRN